MKMTKFHAVKVNHTVRTVEFTRSPITGILISTTDVVNYAEICGPKYAGRLIVGSDLQMSDMHQRLVVGWA